MLPRVGGLGSTCYVISRAVLTFCSGPSLPSGLIPKTPRSQHETVGFSIESA